MNKKLFALVLSVLLSVIVITTPMVQAASVENSQAEMEAVLEMSSDDNSILSENAISHVLEENNGKAITKTGESTSEQIDEEGKIIDESEWKQFSSKENGINEIEQIQEEDLIEGIQTNLDTSSVKINKITEENETIDEKDTIQTSIPANNVAEGSCGEKMSWCLTDDGKLYINGTGEMEDYYYDNFEASNPNMSPWCLKYLRDIKEVYLSDGITSIGKFAFACCYELIKIEIPDSVTTIGDGAFYECSNLKEISIPNGITSIEGWEFYECRSLSEINIPDSVTSIKRCAFEGCDGLNKMKIPKSVIDIGDSIFLRCSNLSEVTILNKNCNIYDSEDTVYDTAVICGYSSSTAEKYAKKYNRIFKALDAQSTTYTITYNANGGKHVPSAQKKTKNKTLTLSKTKPTRTGYTFLGWSTSKSSTKVIYAPGASFKENKNITLYAVWKANMYKVAFNKNGGTGSMSTSSYTYGKSYTLRANTFKRLGYKFKGWNTKADGTGKSYADKAKVSNLSSVFGKTVMLYAQWTANKYSITYVLNGGKNNTANPASYKVTTATVTLKNPTKKGYTFGGWYTSSSYKTRVTKIVKGSTGNKKLYAKWTVNKYTIRYDANGATRGNMADTKSCHYNKTYTLRKNTFVREGYTFVGWAKSAAGSVKYKDQEQVKSVSSVNGKIVTLYAVWQKIES